MGDLIQQVRKDLSNSKEEYSQFIDGYFQLMGVENVGFKRLWFILHIPYTWWAINEFYTGLFTFTLTYLIVEIVFMLYIRICTWVIDGVKKS